MKDKKRSIKEIAAKAGGGMFIMTIAVLAFFVALPSVVFSYIILGGTHFFITIIMFLFWGAVFGITGVATLSLKKEKTGPPLVVKDWIIKLDNGEKYKVFLDKIPPEEGGFNEL